MRNTSWTARLGRPAIRFTLRHPAAVCVLVLLLTGLGLWRLTRLRLDADMLSLLSGDDAVLASYRRAQAEIPGAEALFLVFPTGQRTQTQHVLELIGKLGHVQSILPVGTMTTGDAVFLVALTNPTSDIATSEAAIEQIREIAAGNGLDVRMTGSPAVLVQAREAVRADLRRATVIAGLGVTCFFLLVYPIGWVVVLAIAPIGLGLVWGLAAASVRTPRITLLAATVPTLLVGIGIDYSIHLLQAFRVAAASEGDDEERAIRAFGSVAAPLAIGAVTTAGAFFSLTVGSLKGLADMGWSGGVCVLAVFVAVLLLFPSVLVRCPSRWLTRKGAFDRLLVQTAPFIARHSRTFVAAGVVTVAIATGGLLRLTLATDLDRLQDPSLPARRLQEELAAQVGMSTAPLIVEFDQFDAAVRFSSVLKQPGVGVLGVQPVRTRSGGMAVVHPAVNAFSLGGYQQMETAVAEAAKRAGVNPVAITGAPAVNAHLAGLLRRDLLRVPGVAAAVLLIMLVLGMRSVRHALLALVPLLCALAWTGAVMGLAGWPLNVVSVGVVPLILGIGVDDGVHMLHAWQQCPGRLEDVFTRAGVAVVAATLTTVAAFGAFTVSSTRVLIQLGWQASAGLTICMLVALTVLPALCSMIEYRADEG